MTFIEPKAEVLAFNIPEDAIISGLAHCARTCYQSYDKSTPESDLKLVKHLIKSGHHSVLEHLTITMRLVTSRMVTHELCRHRLASYSERSTRFCDSKDLHIVKPCWFDESIYGERAQATERYVQFMHSVENEYNFLLQNGWHPAFCQTTRLQKLS